MIFYCMWCKKISKAIDNLLSNAIKYNKISGQIKVILQKIVWWLKIQEKGN